MKEYEVLWSQTLDNLRESLEEEIFESLFEELSPVQGIKDSYIYIICPSKYEQGKINRLYLTRINAFAKANYTKHLVGFKFVLEDEFKKEFEPKDPEVDLEAKYRPGNLVATMSFNTFVVGNSNRFAFQMAMKVAEQPGIVANPLYIFGDVGLGKTHLMHAIGNYILDANIATRVLYEKANMFLEQFYVHVKNGQMELFTAKYRNLDVLLIDDIQSISEAEKTQTEFLKVFDYLINQNKQIIITSDKPANELKHMATRLTTRFQQGLTVDIDAPDLELRVDILRKKLEFEPAKRQSLDIAVLEYIASYFTSNVRELEGALNRVLNYCEVNNLPYTVENAAEALNSLISTRQKTSSYDDSTYDKIQSVVSDYYGIKVHDLIGKSRKAMYALPRHIAMYIIKVKYDLPYKTIGSFFNNRDHSTVVNAVDKIESQRKHDMQLNIAIEQLLKKLDN